MVVPIQLSILFQWLSKVAFLVVLVVGNRHLIKLRYSPLDPPWVTDDGCPMPLPSISALFEILFYLFLF